MKSCPTCNRTFEDTLSYCLVDGSILSAPFDPHATIRIPEVRKAEPSPTEVFLRTGVPQPAELLPTLEASPFAYHPKVSSPPPTMAQQKPLTFLQRTGLWLRLALAIIFAVVFSVGMGSLVAAFIFNFVLRNSPDDAAPAAYLTMFLTLVTLLILIFRWWRRKRRELGLRT
jgi:hypothetical protein